MPCVALGQKKVYRATPARKHDRKIRNTQPVTAEKALKPETKELVQTAQAAVEIAAPAKTQKKSRSPKPKAPGKVAQKLKNLKTATLRRSAVKAARTPKTSVPAASAKIVTTSTPGASQPKAKTAAIRLKDGDRIQIRQHRARPTTKPAPAPAVVPATTGKPARALKKNAKSATKPKRRLRFRRPSRAELINAESRLGSMIFGPIPEGHRREFFHDRENIWIWHESWTDAERHARQLTVRYEVRPSGVYKKLSAGKYFKLEGAELENFRKATRTYLSLIKQHIYNAA